MYLKWRLPPTNTLNTNIYLMCFVRSQSLYFCAICSMRRILLPCNFFLAAIFSSELIYNFTSTANSVFADNFFLLCFCYTFISLFFFFRFFCTNLHIGYVVYRFSCCHSYLDTSPQHNGAVVDGRMNAKPSGLCGTITRIIT